VLDPTEKNTFEGMVTRLRADDPKFAHRVDRLSAPRLRLRKALAVALWLMAPVSVGLGGWTGFFIAVAGAAYGLRLVLRGHRLAAGAGSTWRSSPGHRPGAAL
jgi:Protein of unknown function (DUF3040)